jgi:hypothetical protein
MKQRKPAPGRGRPRSLGGPSQHRWLRNVKTVSTFPPPGTFGRDAEHIARVMASPKVSPKGIGSAIRMIQFFLNRGGSRLSAGRRRELERAKRLLQERREAQLGRARAGSRPARAHQEPSRAAGQVLTTRSAGMPARRACAKA